MRAVLATAPDGAGDFFSILPWSPLHGWEPPHTEPEHGLESIADCQFTFAGFVQPHDVPRCEALGLRAILAPPRRPRYMAEEWSSLSDRALDDRVRQTVRDGGDSPAVMGYFVMDEPSAARFPTLGKVVAAFRRHAPGKLAYINLYPNYATIGAPDQSQLGAASYAAYLEQYVAQVRPQFLSYDNYQVLHSQDLAEPDRAALYYRNLLEVRRVAQAHDLPWWQVVSSNQIRRHTPIPSPANLALQAYTTLAAGGTGVGWFTYFSAGYGYAPIDANGRKTATWHALRWVNRQLRAVGPPVSRLRSTGVYLSSSAPCPDFPMLPGELVEEVDSPVPVMVGEFAGRDGSAYALLVNLSLERSAPFTITLAGGRQVRAQASVDDGHFDPVDTARPCWLTAGQGALLAVG